MNHLKLFEAFDTPLVAYHGSDNKFTDFSTEHFGTGDGNSLYGNGFYFTSDPKMAGAFGYYTYTVELDMQRPLEMSADAFMKMMLNYAYEKDTMDGFFEELHANHDGFIITDRKFGGNMKYSTRYEGFTEYVVFSPSQITIVDRN